MVEQQSQEDVKPDTDQQGTQPADPSPTEDDRSVPYSRFREVNEKMKTLETKLEGLKVDREKAEKKQLEEQEKYKELYESTTEELESANAKAKEWDEFQSARREALLSKLTDDDKEFGEAMPLTKLEKFVEKVSNAQVPRVDNTPPTAADAHGYTNVTEAANALARREIDESTYDKVKRYFRSKAGKN